MKAPHRRAHARAWMLGVVLIPLVLAAAWLAPSQHLERAPAPERLAPPTTR